MRIHLTASRTIVLALALVASFAVLGGWRAERVSAAAFTVTKTADTNDGTCDSDCSLREAVVAANATVGHDNISIPAGTYTLTGASGENASASGDLDVTDSVSFNGAGVATTTINGGGIEDVIDVLDSAGTLILTDLTVTNGGFDGVIAGGADIDISNVAVIDNGEFGIETLSGNVSLASSVIDSNADSGIATTSGDVTLNNSTVSRNDNRGIETTTGDTTLTNSTVSNNNDDGIFTQDGDITLHFSTVANNDGNGIQTSESGLIILRGSIVADNDSDDCSDNAEASDHSLDSDGSCGLNGTGDISEGNADLGPLQDNGGPTETLALLGESNAIDAAEDSCPEDDQRFHERFQGEACDIGAFEVDGEQSSPTPTRTPGTRTPSSGNNTRTPTATPTSLASSTAPPSSTRTPASTGNAGAPGGVILLPDTGSGSGGGGSTFALLFGALLLAVAGGFSMAIGRMSRR